MGHDLLALLEHNEVPYAVVEKEVCCGMPKLELGDLEAVDRLKRINIPVLAKYAREGYAILTPVPSCTLMFKQELQHEVLERIEYRIAHRQGLRVIRVQDRQLPPEPQPAGGPPAQERLTLPGL